MAVPTTCTSGSESSRLTIASRIRPWSSPTSTRVGLEVCSLPPSAQRRRPGTRAFGPKSDIAGDDFGRRRPGEQVTLHRIAAEPAEFGEPILGRDAFGDGREG